MGAFKLGKMTFGSLFKKPETVLYPIETKPQPEGLKGHISIDVDTCILCGMCDRSCPTDCINVDKGEHTWSINRYSCVQCGYCVTVCPKKSLAMEPGYAPAATQIAPDTFAIPQEEKRAKAEMPAKGETSAEEKPTPKADEVVSEKAPAERPALKDTVLESKLAIMDPEKAKIVREALDRRAGAQSG